MSALHEIERAARRLWREWGGSWQRYTICAKCGNDTYCGAARRRGPYLCLDCFDVGPYAQRMLDKGST